MEYKELKASNREDISYVEHCLKCSEHLIPGELYKIPKNRIIGCILVQSPIKNYKIYGDESIMFIKHCKERTKISLCEFLHKDKLVHIDVSWLSALQKI